MRRALKTVANALASLLVLPALVAYFLSRSLVGANRAFPGWSQAFALVPGICGVYLRRAFYRAVLPHFASDAFLGFCTILSHPTARVGAGTYVGPFCCLGDVTLGDDVLLGSHVSVINGGGQHGIERLDVPVRLQPGTYPRVTIGRDTWIGDRAAVLADVGAHCVIGAGSVVTKPVPDYAIAVGVPARVIGYRNGSRPGAAAPEPDAEVQPLPVGGA
jgi:acetyltransferase-like isoleucine patch superfamily enzyme